MTIKNAIPKFITLLLVSIAAAFLVIAVDRIVLTRIDSMSATDYIASQRKMHHHSFIYHLIMWTVLGGLYLASIEFIAYVIGLCFKKGPSADQNL